MSLSHMLDWELIRDVNRADEIIDDVIILYIDEELDNRYPDNQYGSCDNQFEFLPTEPEWDDRPIVEMEYEEAL